MPDRRNRRVQPLEAPLRVDERPALLRKRRPRQDIVRRRRCLRRQNINHHQEFQLRQQLRLQYIFAEHNQRRNRPGVDAGNDLRDVVTKPGQLRPRHVRRAVGVQQKPVALTGMRYNRPQRRAKLRQEEQLLRRRPRRPDHRDAFRIAQLVRHLPGRLRPRQALPVADHRRFHPGRRQPARIIDELEVQSAVIAHPTSIDRLVLTRRLAVNNPFARPEHRVAAGGAVRANAFRLLQEPDALLEAEIVRRQRPNRAEVHDVQIVIRLRRVTGIAGQRRVTAPIHKTEAILSRHVAHEPDAARTEDAPLILERNLVIERRLLRLVHLLLDKPALALAVVHR